MTSVSQSTRITQNEVLPALGRCDRSVSIEHEESAQPVTYFLFHRSAQNHVVEETWSQGRLMKSMSDTPITEENLYADNKSEEVPEEPKELTTVPVYSGSVRVWDDGPAIVGQPITFYAYYQAPQSILDAYYYVFKDRYNESKSRVVIGIDTVAASFIYDKVPEGDKHIMDVEVYAQFQGERLWKVGQESRPFSVSNFTDDSVDKPQHEVPEIPEDFTTEAPIEEPLTDSSTFDPLPDEQTESPYKFDAKCSCYMKSWAMRAPVDSSPLLGRLLTEAPKPEHCNNQGMKDCIAFCREKVHEVTNDFDLTKVPNTDDGSVTVSLGQYLCNLVGRHFFPKYMQTYAQMDCRSTYGSSHSIVSKHIASTGSYSKQPLVCIRGIFYRGSLNA